MQLTALSQARAPQYKHNTPQPQFGSRSDVQPRQKNGDQFTGGLITLLGMLALQGLGALEIKPGPLFSEKPNTAEVAPSDNQQLGKAPASLPLPTRTAERPIEPRRHTSDPIHETPIERSASPKKGSPSPSRTATQPQGRRTSDLDSPLRFKLLTMTHNAPKLTRTGPARTDRFA